MPTENILTWQDGSLFTINKDSLKYDRYFLITCYIENAKYVGEGTIRFKTLPQEDKVTLEIKPSIYGVSGSTQFTIGVTKNLGYSDDKPLFCEFY